MLFPFGHRSLIAFAALILLVGGSAFRLPGLTLLTEALFHALASEVFDQCD